MTDERRTLPEAITEQGNADSEREKEEGERERCAHQKYRGWSNAQDGEDHVLDEITTSQEEQAEYRPADTSTLARGGNPAIFIELGNETQGRDECIER